MERRKHTSVCAYEVHMVTCEVGTDTVCAYKLGTDTDTDAYILAYYGLCK